MLSLSASAFDRRAGSVACMVIGILGIWVSALAVPVVAEETGGPYLLVACAVFQFIGTLIGGRIKLDLLFLAAACAAVSITAFPAPGVLAFGFSFGAAFKRYLDSVTQPVQAARLEFCGQVAAACIFVPIAFFDVCGDGWDCVLYAGGMAAALTSVAVRADARDISDAPAPSRILVAFFLVSAGIASFSLGGVLTISKTESKWSGSKSPIFATAVLLGGAMLAAAISGYDWPTPAVRFRLGCYACSMTAIASIWAQTLTGYLIMSVAFGFGAGLTLINARNVCFNNSNVYFILCQRLSDCVPPLLLAMGATSRELMQTAPAFIAIGLMALPSEVDRIAAIALSQIR